MRAVAPLFYFILDVVYLFVGGIQGCSDKKDISQQHHIYIRRGGL
jgi:hypothetical protein